MRGISGNHFHEALLKFQLQKPDSWHFIPAAWSPVAQLKNSANPDFDWAARAKLPFCCAQRHHDSLDQVYPTLQVCCRPLHVPDNSAARSMLQASIDFLAREYQDFSVINCTSEAIIAGFRANALRASYCFPASQAGTTVWFPVITRCFQIFAPNRAFTLALTSSPEPEYHDEAEMDSIIASVRIGN